MSEDTQTSPNEAPPMPSQEDLDKLAEIKTMLFDENYVPEESARHGATIFPIDQRLPRAMNHFYTWFPGFGLRRVAEANLELLHKPRPEWRGHTSAELLSYIDELIEAKGLDPKVIANYAEASDKKKDAERLAFQQYIFPVFEALVLEKGFPAEGIIV